MNLPFHLIIRPNDIGKTEERFLQYINDNAPIITQDEDGRVSVGIIFFENLQTKPLQLESLESVPKTIDSLLIAKPDHAVCILFEQTTGTPLLVVVRNDDVDVLTTLLASGFQHLDAMGHA
jgi:hypothetical protein